MTRPLVLLDVDGVLNIIGGENDAWDVLCSGSGVAEGNRYPITWAPAVIDQLTAWLEVGVDIHWLTTWGHDANTSLRHLLGLPELPVAATYDRDPAGTTEDLGLSHAASAPAAPDPLTGRWWKYDAVARHLRADPDRPLVWIDDELRPGMRFRRWADEHPMVHAIGPDPTLGLLPEDLAEVDALLR